MFLRDAVPGAGCRSDRTIPAAPGLPAVAGGIGAATKLARWTIPRIVHKRRAQAVVALPLRYRPQRRRAQPSLYPAPGTASLDNENAGGIVSSSSSYTRCLSPSHAASALSLQVFAVLGPLQNSLRSMRRKSRTFAPTLLQAYQAAEVSVGRAPCQQPLHTFIAPKAGAAGAVPASRKPFCAAPSRMQGRSCVSPTIVGPLARPGEFCGRLDGAAQNGNPWQSQGRSSRSRNSPCHTSLA